MTGEPPFADVLGKMSDDQIVTLIRISREHARAGVPIGLIGALLLERMLTEAEALTAGEAGP